MGTALSRWTMAYFTAALVFLMAAQTMMAMGYGYPTVAVEAPETLVLVHTVTIGWLSLLMCGALLQFVPVLVAKPLQSEKLVLPALLCLLSGLVCLLAGFLHLAGAIETDLPLLPAAATLLPAGFLLVVIVVARTLWSVRPARLPLPARFVAIGLACLAVTFAIGALFALVLSGLLPLDLRTEGLSIHIAAGVGGWLTFTAIGVSYRLLPMFMLAPDEERAASRAVWRCGILALLCFAAAPLERLAGGLGIFGPAAAVLALAALYFYGLDLVFLYRNRKRRKLELNMKAAIGAFVAFFACGLLLPVAALTGTLEMYSGAVFYLAAFGWLTGLGLSQLYKIVPFLTWLECFGAVMGRKPTPRVQDLVAERRARLWFALYFTGVAIGTGALACAVPGLFRLASAMTLVAIGAIIVELVVSRRLLNLPERDSLPEGASRPRLFLPSAR